MDLPRYPELNLGAIEVNLRSGTRRQNPTPLTTCRNALNRYDISIETTNGKQNFQRKRRVKLRFLALCKKSVERAFQHNTGRKQMRSQATYHFP